jgi:tetratricopeptide (TPR) repeat protein/class 3 adenylate cyclase/TolB-like protein
MIGELISHYRILRQLGAGGMGVVYLARDEQLHRDVAIKLLSPGVLSDPQAQARFRSEAQLLARLNHPFIEMVFDFGTIRDQDYIVLEYVPGETLRELTSAGAVAEREVLRLGIMLASGLEAAHEKGILHRDLKPSNLIRTPEGRLKILDFGLAIAQPSRPSGASQPSETKFLAGTLPYLAPEQLTAEADPRTDVYAAGAVLFELSTGVSLFPSANPSELMDSILHEAPPFPRQLNPALSPVLEGILLKALRKNPEERFQSASELRAELEHALAAAQSGNANFERSQAPVLEMAYVLFTDIVGYSRLATDTQQNLVRRFQRIVRETAEFQRAQKDDRLVSLPTGDGMALAFFTDPESPIRCSLAIATALKTVPEIQLRMGLHAGPVYRVKDINGNQNVAGEGINIAQRVMDCGDAGHILLSKTLVDVLRQLTGWAGAFQDLGEVSVKHGVRVHIFNLQRDGVGNGALPGKVKPPPSPPKRKVLWITLAAVFLVGFAVGFWWLRGRILPGYALRPTVAVLGFKNQTATPESQWVSTSLSDMLASELSVGDFVVTSHGQPVAQMKTDLGLLDEASYSPATIHRIQKSLNCDYVVYGSFFDPGKPGGGRVRLDLQLQRTSNGQVLFTMTDTATETDLPRLATRMGVSLREKLGLPGVTQDPLAKGLPSNQDAMREYYQGLTKLWNLDLLGAKASLEQAVRSDPDFSLAHAALAVAWQGLGYDDNARQEAKTSFDLSANLRREDKTLVEARFREMSFDWDKSIDLYRSLWTVYPESPEYAYHAADVQIRAGKAKDALLTVAELRKQPGELAGNPLIDLREAEAWEALGDFAKEKSAAARSQEIAAAIGTRMVEGQAAWRACSAMNSLGEFAAGKVACDQAVQIAEATGYQLLLARSITGTANNAQGQGNLASALRQHTRALEIARKIGSQRDVVGALTNIGLVQSFLGDHSAAAQSYQEGLLEARNINDQLSAVTLLNNQAGENQIVGNFKVALSLYQQSLDIARNIGDQGGAGRALGNIGAIDSLQGNFNSALQNLQDAMRTTQDTGIKSNQAGFFYALGDTRLAQGDLAAAESNYQSGASLSAQIKDKTNIAVGQLSLGTLWFQQRKTDQAISPARQAADEFHAEGMGDQESSSRNLLASCLLDQKKLADAESELRAAQRLSPQDPTIKLAIDITASRLAARNGSLAQSRKDLEGVANKAQRLGVPGLQFEAQLAEGELGLFGGDKRDALSVLAGLQAQALRKGYKQFAVRAQATARQLSNGK